MLALIGLFVGAWAGYLLWHDWGAALGGIAGFLAGARFLRPSDPAAGRGPPAAAPPPSAESSAAAPAAGTPVRDAVMTQAPGAFGEGRPGAEAAAGAEVAVPDGLGVAAASSPEPAATPTAGVAAPGPPRVHPLWAWFTGGNAITRIGVVVLFFGVAFLLRYFAEHFTIPIELRLAAVAACGIVLMALGLRLAASRPGYGLSLQGAGAGVLYLTVYAAFRPYAVLPQGPSIGLLVAVSALTVRLALRSDSQPLAGLAIAGGFLAPMLVATGGDPALLFGYFALLNGAIFTLAWTKAWRVLNVVGFVFTFALGAVWGHAYYRPEHYAVVQPFLALFFAFYVAIAILEARRAPAAATNPVDGLLVFGVPLVGFALQAALVRDVRHGAAWSALAIGGVYAGLFLALRRRGEPGLALLARAFLALAVIFTAVAVPFVLEARWTAALWAVGAAGVYWIGAEQDSRLARALALVIQTGAGIAFAAGGVDGSGDALFANAFFAGALLIAISGLVTARVADRAGERLTAAERGFVPLLFAWGLLWWLAAGGVELVRHLARADEVHAVLAWVVVTVALALALRRALAWPRLADAGVALLPAMAIAALGDFHLARTTLTAYGWLVWPCAWLVHGLSLRVADRLHGDDAGAAPAGPAAMLPAVHAASALAFVAQLCWEASEWTARSTAPHTAWTACAAALPALAALLAVVRLDESALWPVARYRRAYARSAGGPVAGFATFWFFAVNALSPGDPAPLPYLPLANPLDLTLALAFWAVWSWTARFAARAERSRYQWAGAALFVALNGAVLRTAHHWADIPWRLGALLASKPLQAALTLAWTATALALMLAATRRGLRPLWMLGAGLLAVVVGKLFLVDLGALSGLPRVTAFLGVGILLLVIGYLSPLPPAEPPRAPPANEPPPA